MMAKHLLVEYYGLVEKKDMALFSRKYIFLN